MKTVLNGFKDQNVFIFEIELKIIYFYETIKPGLNRAVQTGGPADMTSDALPAAGKTSQYNSNIFQRTSENIFSILVSLRNISLESFKRILFPDQLPSDHPDDPGPCGNKTLLRHRPDHHDFWIWEESGLGGSFWTVGSRR